MSYLSEEQPRRSHKNSGYEGLPFTGLLADGLWWHSRSPQMLTDPGSWGSLLPLQARAGCQSRPWICSVPGEPVLVELGSPGPRKGEGSTSGLEKQVIVR